MWQCRTPASSSLYMPDESDLTSSMSSLPQCESCGQSPIGCVLCRICSGWNNKIGKRTHVFCFVFATRSASASITCVNAHRLFSYLEQRLADSHPSSIICKVRVRNQWTHNGCAHKSSIIKLRKSAPAFISYWLLCSNTGTVHYEWLMLTNA